MKPTEKAPAIKRLLDSMSNRTQSIEEARCIPAPFGCGQEIKGFKNTISMREYSISGMCQECQDKFFK